MISTAEDKQATGWTAKLPDGACALRWNKINWF